MASGQSFDAGQPEIVGFFGNLGEVTTIDEPSHGFDYSLSLTVPPLAFVLLTPRVMDPPGA